MMASDTDPTLRRVPSLVSYCQRGEHRFAHSPPRHTPHSSQSSQPMQTVCPSLSPPPLLFIIPAAIACLGDDVRYDVVKPVLECCSADTLLRLEQSSPVSPSPIHHNLLSSSIQYLEQDTSGMSAMRLPSPLTLYHRSLGTSLLQVLSLTCRTACTRCRPTTRILARSIFCMSLSPIGRGRCFTYLHSFFARPRHIASKRSHYDSEISVWRPQNARENERSN